MLPTRPRADERSMCSSCTTPCSSMATRVSCGVTLMTISWLMAQRLYHRKADAGQDPGRFVQWQAHDARVAALEVLHERGGLALDRVAAGFIERLAGGDIAFDLIARNRPQGHARSRHRRNQLCLPAHGDRGDHFVRS